MLTFLMLGAALADDFDFDKLFGEIDIGGSTAESFTYSGSSVAVSGATTPGARATIRHSSGNLTIRCGQVEQVKAVLSYTLDGTDQASMKRYGDALVVTATGQGAAVSVNTSKPARPALSRHAADLVVTAPLGVVIDAEALAGDVRVEGCTAAVKARAGGALTVRGPVLGFELASANGDVNLVLEEGGTLGAKSAVTAEKGAVNLAVGMPQNAKLDARGASVDVRQGVAGRVEPALVLGDMGDGGAPLVVRAGGAVVISPR